MESAIVATVPANNAGYTAIVRGSNNGTSIGVVEVYDLDRSVDSELGNISTPGLVQTGDNVLVAGTIMLDQAPKRVLIRAIGPSLPLPGTLADPVLELRDVNGASLLRMTTGAAIRKRKSSRRPYLRRTIWRPAIVHTLPAGGAAYTAIVRGARGSTGIAGVEVYALN